MENKEHPQGTGLLDLLLEAMSVQRHTTGTLVSVLNKGSFQEEPKSPVIKVWKRGFTVQQGQICEVKCCQNIPKERRYVI